MSKSEIMYKFRKRALFMQNLPFAQLLEEDCGHMEVCIKASLLEGGGTTKL